MCRYVEDAVIVLNAIYGPDKHDPTVADASFKWNPDRPLSGIRIGYVRAGFESQDPQRQVYRDALDVYRKLGANLTPVDLPDMPLTGMLSFILEVEAAASFDDLTRSGEVNQLRTGTSASSWPNTFKAARFVPAVEYLRAQRARTILMQQMDQFMSKFDVLLSAGSDATLSTTNLTGHPAMSVKCGFVNNLPRILMLTGQLYDEATMARVALAYEQATEWKDRHPALKGEGFRSIVTFFISTGVTGRSFRSTCTAPIFCTTSMPDTTAPKTECLRSRCGVGPSVMKNWLPLVFGPALAIERMPARSWRKSGWNSSSN
jgi:Asp-tRNA(Asn)/Glu-tRNA(Gln) amidotransferase A subunit family amidase